MKLNGFSILLIVLTVIFLGCNANLHKQSRNDEILNALLYNEYISLVETDRDFYVPEYSPKVGDSVVLLKGIRIGQFDTLTKVRSNFIAKEGETIVLVNKIKDDLWGIRILSANHVNTGFLPEYVLKELFSPSLKNMKEKYFDELQRNRKNRMGLLAKKYGITVDSINSLASFKMVKHRKE